jgi:hypothetical protein
MLPSPTIVSDAILRARDAFMAWHDCKEREFPDTAERERLAVAALELLFRVIRVSHWHTSGALLSADERLVIDRSISMISDHEDPIVLRSAIAEFALQLILDPPSPSTSAEEPPEAQP